MIKDGRLHCTVCEGGNLETVVVKQGTTGETTTEITCQDCGTPT